VELYLHSPNMSSWRGHVIVYLAIPGYNSIEISVSLLRTVSDVVLFDKYSNINYNGRTELDCELKFHTFLYFLYPCDVLCMRDQI